MPAPNTACAPANRQLPASLTPLIGRDADLDALAMLLENPDVRLVTLTGPGGVGKTRLAIEAARRVVDHFQDGAIFVPLETTVRADQFLVTVGQALEVRQPGSYLDVDALADVLRDRQLLLVLDNFEQLVDAAPQLTALLQLAPSLTALVTSRVVLRVQGEIDYTVEPLRLPGDDATPELTAGEQAPAVQLFVSRARAADRHFRLTSGNLHDVVEICRRLDGLPLAIELAAARIRTLQPHGLLARLDRRLPFLTGGARHAPARQQTLRDAIAWSYDLLNADEQRLFRHLAVFRGGSFTLEAAAFVSGDPADEAFERLAMLTDANLILPANGPDGESRYRMLETIREFGLEQLEAAGETPVARDRHVEWFSDFRLRSGYLINPTNLARFEADLDNIREALRYVLGQGNVAATLSFAGILCGYWYLIGAAKPDAVESLLLRIRSDWPGGNFDAEAREWADRTVEGDAFSFPSTIDTSLFGAAWLAQLEGDYRRAWRISELVMEHNRKAGDTTWVAQTCVHLTVIAAEEGDDEAVIEYARRALPMFSELKDTLWIPHLYVQLGTVLYHRGDPDGAEEYFVAALDGFCGQNLRWAEAAPTTYLARIARDRGDHQQALQLQQEALRIRQRYNDRYAAASNLRGIGELARFHGQHIQAARLYGAAASLRKQQGLPLTPPGVAKYQRDVAALEETIGSTCFQREWRHGAGLTFREAVELALERDLEVDTASSGPNALTPRETEILQLIVQGLTAQEIAGKLSISPRTVSTHQSNIYGKFGVSSQAAAIAHAYRTGLVTPPGNTSRNG